MRIGIGTLEQDLRYAWRMLRRNPGFAAVAVLTIALGIGANTAIFTVVNAVLLEPLPYPDSGRLVELHEGQSVRQVTPTYPNFRDWQSESRVFVSMGASMDVSMVLAGKGEPVLVPVSYVSEGMLPTLGIKPYMGRGILPSDDQPSASPVALISHDFWQRVFRADAQAIGSSLRLDGTSYTVVGVMPRDFHFLHGSRPEVFLPLGLLANTTEKRDRAKHEGLIVVARVAPARTLKQAQSEMDAISGRLAKAYPNIDYERQCMVRSLYEVTVGDIRLWLLILLGAVSLVLLIACANVANLLLARANARQPEMAIRLALGAPRFRLFRQLLTESIFLALVGGVLGVLLASAGVQALLRAAPETLVRVEEIHLNRSVLLFILITAVVSGVGFGLAPALHIARFRGAVQQQANQAFGNARRRGKNVLVVGEVAVSVVLLLGAGLLVRSFVQLIQVDAGLNPKNVITADVHIPENNYKTQQEMDLFYDAIVSNLNAAPGVQSAAITRPLPFSGEGWGYGYRLEGEPMLGPSEFHRAFLHYITPEYLKTMQVPLRAGRNFTSQDNDSSTPVALVNQSFVTRRMGNQDPLGKRIRLGGARDLASDQNPWFTIVGVIGNVKLHGLADTDVDEILVPFDQHQRYHVAITSRNIVVRAEGNPSVAVQQLRRVVSMLGPGQPVNDVVTMEQLIARSMSSDRTLMFLITTFAAMALLLSAIGIYGVISYWVSQRTREIGIRMALGAARRDITKVVLGEGARLIFAGLALGIPAAFLASRLIAGMLFGVGPYDLATFAVVPLVLAAVAVLACYMPARRAAAIEPMAALRCE